MELSPRSPGSPDIRVTHEETARTSNNKQSPQNRLRTTGKAPRLNPLFSLPPVRTSTHPLEGNISFSRASCPARRVFRPRRQQQWRGVRSLVFGRAPGIVFRHRWRRANRYCFRPSNRLSRALLCSALSAGLSRGWAAVAQKGRERERGCRVPVCIRWGD